MNVADAAKVLDQMAEKASGTDKIALVVASTFIRRVMRARGAVMDLAKAVSPDENLNQKGLFDDG